MVQLNPETETEVWSIASLANFLHSDAWLLERYKIDMLGWAVFFGAQEVEKQHTSKFFVLYITWVFEVVFDICPWRCEIFSI